MQDKNDKRGGQKNPLSGEAEQLPLVPQMLKQPNELTRSFYRCSGTAQKLFMAAVATFVGEKKSAGDRWLVIKFKETLQSFSIVDGSETRDTFRKAVEEISELSVVLLDDGNSYHKLNLFEEALFDWRKGVIEFKPSEKFAAFLEVEHRRGYTLFNIESVGKLSSFYAMRYFEIAMSYKGFMGHVKSSDGWAESNGVDLGRSWFFSYSISELKKLFMIGDGAVQAHAELRQESHKRAHRRAEPENPGVRLPGAGRQEEQLPAVRHHGLYLLGDRRLRGRREVAVRGGAS